MKTLLEKYKWQVLLYIIYASFVPVWLGNGLDLRHEDFWYGIIICYFAVPLIIYTIYYLIKYKVLGKPVDTDKKEEIKTVSPLGKGNSWSLIEFAKQHGNMRIYRNEEGFLYLCVFTNADGKVTRAGVDWNLRFYGAVEIQNEKEDLVIITLDSGKYCLCKKQEDVEL